MIGTTPTPCRGSDAQRAPDASPPAPGRLGTGLAGGGGGGPGLGAAVGSPARARQPAGLRRLPSQWRPAFGQTPAPIPPGHCQRRGGAAGRRPGLRRPVPAPGDRRPWFHQSHPETRGVGGGGGPPRGRSPPRRSPRHRPPRPGSHRDGAGPPGSGDRRFLQPQHRQGDACGTSPLHDHRRLFGAGAGVPRPSGAAPQPCRRLGHPVRHAHHPPQGGGAGGAGAGRRHRSWRSGQLLPPGQATLRRRSGVSGRLPRGGGASAERRSPQPEGLDPPLRPIPARVPADL